MRQVALYKKDGAMAKYYESKEFCRSFVGSIGSREGTLAPAPMDWPYSLSPSARAMETTLRLMTVLPMCEIVALEPKPLGSKPAMGRYLLKVQVDREKGYVEIENSKYSLPSVCADEKKAKLIRKMRSEYMNKVSDLTRISLNVRMGILSGTRCVMDWEMSAQSDKVKALSATDAGIWKKLGQSTSSVTCAWRDSYAGSDDSRSKAAWTGLLGRYLTNVIPLGRYYLPCFGNGCTETGAREIADMMWSEWVAGCGELQKSLGTRELDETSRETHTRECKRQNRGQGQR
jgi:hypothetical protein